MKVFLALDSSSAPGEQVYLNLVHVVAIHRQEEPNNLGAKVWMSNGTSYLVIETPREIVDALASEHTKIVGVPLNIGPLEEDRKP